jgi:UDP-N-acetylmuramate dehydrogenase
LKGVKKNISLKNYTTFRIGGKAKYFFVAKNREQLFFAILTAEKNKLPFFILGGGSNILVSDKGFNGLIIKVGNNNWALRKNKIFGGAGVNLSKLVNIAKENNLSGLEWAAGIPGTLGGAIYGNAGAFGVSMKDIIKSVEVFDTKKGKTVLLENQKCKFSYRDSIFKKNKNLIIISAEITLLKSSYKKITKRINEFLEYRINFQPLNFPSAGSVFKNPQRKSAGELIEKANLKGTMVGGAKISEKHANFIVNSKNAKSKDVENLINLIKKTIKKNFGIILEEEIQFLTKK